MRWMRPLVALTTTATMLAGCPLVRHPKPVHDLVITDVRYLRGDQITAERYSVAVRGDRISYVGRRQPIARRTIDGHGCVLAPGFLDTNIAGFVLPGKPSELKLHDGVTAYLSAHGGLAGDSLARHGIPAVLNYATTVGLAGLGRIDEPGFDVFDALQKALAAGAYGISLSPEYDPERLTPELVRAICQRFGPAKVPISFHTRYSSRDQELAGVDEAFECARLGAPVHILHISSTGGTYHPREALAIVMHARSMGLTLFFDFYPYTAWGSSIQRARFRGDWLARYGVDWTRVRLPGRATPLDAKTFEALRRSGQRREIVVESIPQPTVDFIALETSAPIGTDSPPDPRRGLHPRGVGSFAKFIRDYVHSGKIPLGKALYRVSTRACTRFAPYLPELAQRGRIKRGYAADLILWDPEAIRDNATLEQPDLPSTGVVAALVNGVPLIVEGRFVPPKGATGHWMRGRLARGS
jgi:hypothetical protein